jgi:DNA polymerase III alpha subunit (gram-positive type)
MAKHAEMYVSTDIETDGPTPGLNSMLSLASVVYDRNKAPITSFAVNLETLPEASPHPVTWRWWRTQPEAWAACRRNPEPPATAMDSYLEWLGGLPGQPVFVAYPATFDFAFVSYYLMRFTGENPFGFAGLDIKSYAMALTGEAFRQTTRERMPSELFDDLPHTHIAVDDAREQGALFCNLLAWRECLLGEPRE